MRLIVKARGRTFDLEWSRDEPPGPEQRDTALDSHIQLADPHPEVDRPIGFRRNGDDW